jgi:hypothetical protein
MTLTIIEDYSPITKGDTLALLKPHFRHKDKSPVSLAGMSISMVMQSRDDPLDVKATTGTWEHDDEDNGIAHFNYGDEDVDTAGVYYLIITITEIATGRPVHADAKKLRILPLPVVPGP